MQQAHGDYFPGIFSFAVLKIKERKKKTTETRAEKKERNKKIKQKKNKDRKREGKKPTNGHKKKGYKDKRVKGDTDTVSGVNGQGGTMSYSETKPAGREMPVGL